MSQLPNYVLLSVVPSILLSLLIALVAILGITRWRRTVLALAIIALLLMIVGALALRIPFLHSAGFQSQFAFTYLPTIAGSMIDCAFVIGEVGIFLTLVLSARSRLWGWFTALLITAVISMLAAQFAFSSFPLYIFVGIERAQELFTAPLYAIITNILAGLAMVAQLLYALIDPKTTTAVTTAVAPEVG
ncbi:MAG TPA: hypothetical protein VFW17_16805 [Ktedonobacterales bacterium]|nr:hypothetical protein [Ktedonobacterales bacterium]